MVKVRFRFSVRVLDLSRGWYSIPQSGNDPALVIIVLHGLLSQG